MNTELADKIANALNIVENRDGFESVGEIQTAIDLISNTPAARVVSGGVVVMDWVSANSETVRYAESIVRARIDALNASLDEKIEASGCQPN
jgi:hypothetical protein